MMSLQIYGDRALTGGISEGGLRGQDRREAAGMLKTLSILIQVAIMQIIHMQNFTNVKMYHEDLCTTLCALYLNKLKWKKVLWGKHCQYATSGLHNYYNISVSTPPPH